MGNSSVDMRKLKSAVDNALVELRPFRENRRNFIELYSGENYGHNRETVGRTPLNMLELAIGTYTYRLATSSPRADVSTRYNELKSSAETLRLALDYLCDNLDIRKTICSVISDALFSMGIVKVGINDNREMIRGFSHESGQPFVGVVSLDDFVYDTSAKSFEQCQFFGNRLFVDYEALKKCKNYTNIDQIRLANEGRINGESPATEMTTGKPKSLSGYRDRAIIWEFYLPFENRIITTDEDISVIIRSDEWTGPRNGPYHFLRFNPVPDNIMPLPPAALWVDIHKVANVLWEKLFDQSKRQKKILPYDGGTVEAAQRIQSSRDGDVVRVESAESFRELNFGGPDQSVLAICLQLESIFSRYAGNLDIAGGLSPSGNTATQAAILNQNSSTKFENMSSKLTAFVGEIMKDLAYWLWTDPNINIPLVKRPVKTVELKVNFNESAKIGNFLDYNFSIVPYSMNPKTPEMKGQEMLQLLQAVYQPYAQLFAQSGIQLDVKELMRIISEATGIYELNSILTIGDPMQSMEGDMPVDKPQTHSIYERVSRSGESYNKQSTDLARQIMNAVHSGRSQEGEQ